MSESAGDLAQRSSWGTRLALALAVAAMIVAVWAVRSIPKQVSSAPTGQTSVDPKMQACNDFKVVREAVKRQTHAAADPASAAAQIVDTNARLAMSSGADYLLSRLDPNTPAEIADPLRRLVVVLLEISMYAQAGTAYAEPDEAARLADAEALSSQLSTLCG